MFFFRVQGSLGSGDLLFLQAYGLGKRMESNSFKLLALHAPMSSSCHPTLLCRGPRASRSKRIAYRSRVRIILLLVSIDVAIPHVLKHRKASPHLQEHSPTFQVKERTSTPSKSLCGWTRAFPAPGLLFEVTVAGDGGGQ